MSIFTIEGASPPPPVMVPKGWLPAVGEDMPITWPYEVQLGTRLGFPYQEPGLYDGELGLEVIDTNRMDIFPPYDVDLGSFLGICTASDCMRGAVSVRQMLEVKKNLANKIGTKFDAAAAGIYESYKTTMPTIEVFGRDVGWAVPSACCAVRDIGEQAQALSNEMLIEAGERGLPEPPSGEGWQWTALKALAVLGVAGLTVWGGAKIVKAVREAKGSSMRGLGRPRRYRGLRGA
jgi:hypothetical protein